MSKPLSKSRPILRWWSRLARGLLIVVAIPVGLRFATASRATTSRPAAWPQLMVDPNRVPAPVLEALPGLGPALAGRIVAARSERPFTSMQDLDRRVKGIGPAKSALLAPFFRFTGR